MRVTLSGCRASADAYDPETIEHVSDEKLDQLEVRAFACMRLGGSGVRYGYWLKSLVDFATGEKLTDAVAHAARERAIKDYSDAFFAALEPVTRQTREVADKYNSLVDRYNELLSTAKGLQDYADRVVSISNQMYEVAERALGASWYPQPAVAAPRIPEKVYIVPPQLHCTTTTYPSAAPGLASFSYTNCY